jgi:hypothetical protein
MVLREFRREFNVQPNQLPSRKSVRLWYIRFKETGSVENRKGAGRPRTSDANVLRVRNAFENSPTVSVRRASINLDMPKSSVHDVVKKQLHLFPYKIQILHELLPDDFQKRFDYSVSQLHLIEEDETALFYDAYSDEFTLHVCGKVNRHNCRIWGAEKPQQIRQHARDSPKVNCWCAVLRDRVIGPFFFAERTVTAITYLDILENYAIPQLQQAEEEWGHELRFQQDGAPPHWGLIVRECLDRVFPGRWIGRGGPVSWPPRSPDLTPPDFFLWG